MIPVRAVVLRIVGSQAAKPRRMYPTCEIEEYASSRFILVCVNAARLPQVKDAIATPPIKYTQVVCKSPKTTNINRRSIAKLAVFEATLTYADMGVGAPSYTSGAHWWNGTAATLKNMPAATVTNARITSQSVTPCADVYAKRRPRMLPISAIFVELLTPYNNEKP